MVVRSCCPAWLHQARVRAYLGTLTPGEMGGLVTASRQAQNYFHHNTMFALPYFNDLTAKWVFCRSQCYISNIPGNLHFWFVLRENTCCSTNQ